MLIKQLWILKLVTNNLSTFKSHKKNKTNLINTIPNNKKPINKIPQAKTTQQKKNKKTYQPKTKTHHHQPKKHNKNGTNKFIELTCR